MTLIEKMGLEENILESFEKVDARSQEAWDNGLSSVEEELKSEAASYISEERTRSAKIAELSRIKMLG
jgi:hypothetical protein